MKKWHKHLLNTLLSLLLILTIFNTGCGATSSQGGPPADDTLLAPPAPPPQLPSFLKFPESIREISLNVVLGPGTGVLAAYPIGSDVRFFVKDSAILANALYDLTDIILEPLSQLEIPIGFNTTYETYIIVEGNQVFHTKIDFSNFENRDCSGNTAALPICYRIWLDGQRTLYGQFDSYPTDISAGSGDLNGSYPFLLPSINPILSANYFDVFSIRYHLENQAEKDIDLAVRVYPEFSDVGEFRVVIQQQPIADSLIKTIFLTATDFEADRTSQDIFQWIDDENFFSGDSESNIYDPFCARLSTSLTVDPQICIDLGMNVFELEFIELLGLQTFEYPADFPEEPPF